MLITIGDQVIRSFRPDDVAALVKYANNRNVSANFVERFPFPYTEADDSAANPMDTALRFVETINSGDVDAVMRLMTEQAVFVDAEGHQLQGKEQLRAAWRARVDEGLVSRWQVYADNEPVRQLMASLQD